MSVGDDVAMHKPEEGLLCDSAIPLLSSHLETFIPECCQVEVVRELLER